MHKNFKSIIWIAGHFGIIGREHAEKLIYKGKYGYISANRTFAKLEREYRILKRIDRGKRKADAYKLTHNGIKKFRKLYGYEPKNYNSGDKLSHSVQIVNFYIHLVNHMGHMGRLKKDYDIINERKNIFFNVQKEIKYIIRDKVFSFIPDAFCIYRYKKNMGKVFYLEIENSNRVASYVSSKTIKNYEMFYQSGKWKNEKWQPKNKVFPYILITCYSDFKALELIKHFKKNMKINLPYYFSDYKTLKENGIYGKVWYNIDGSRVSLF